MASTYKAAGVDIAAADSALAKLKGLIRSTHGPEVLPDLGQFASLVALPRGMREPVLVSSTDGVGTKLRIAQLAGRHEGIGIDLVALNVNDVVVYGARPLLFLDYVAVGKLAPLVYQSILRGIVAGCTQAGCALVGGETAEMPGLYEAGEYDVAGFCVGIVERKQIIDGSKVAAGDVVLGLASSGVHANGFSLVRKVFAEPELKRLQRELLKPTRIYVKPVLELAGRISVHAIAHVTGGGLARRLPSLVSKRPGLAVRLSEGSWPVPKIFQRIQVAGRIDPAEMAATFNMGIGMVIAVASRDAGRAQQILARAGVSAWPIGSIQRTNATLINKERTA